METVGMLQLIGREIMDYTTPLGQKASSLLSAVVKMSGGSPAILQPLSL